MDRDIGGRRGWRMEKWEEGPMERGRDVGTWERQKEVRMEGWKEGMEKYPFPLVKQL